MIFSEGPLGRWSEIDSGLVRILPSVPVPVAVNRVAGGVQLVAVGGLLESPVVPGVGSPVAGGVQVVLPFVVVAPHDPAVEGYHGVLACQVVEGSHRLVLCHDQPQPP